MPFLNFSYRERTTAIHGLNPVVKLAWALSIVIMAMIIDHPLVLGLIFLSTVPVAFAARVHREWLVFIRIALYMGVIVVLINALASTGGNHLIWQSGINLPLLGPLNLTLEALIYGVFMAVRLLAIISAFAIMTFVLHPNDLLMVMLKMKLPYKTAMLTTLSTRFVPVLLEDAGRIADAQKSRGLEMDRGNILKRIQHRSSILLSLLANSLERTIQIAEAMEARAFGSITKRTFFHSIAFSRLDGLIIASFLLMLAASFYGIAAGLFEFQYYPVLNGFLMSPSGWVVTAAILTVLIGLIPAARLKKGVDFDQA
ncbi:MAG: energy-coupling factor transporter transmembrane protein EcfT [Dehalococcoidaceae bacterium]|nr:energy-coupling factor transporter transmembrane protein EcfT [Dehalococcoidaceae bacterium]